MMKKLLRVISLLLGVVVLIAAAAITWVLNVRPGLPEYAAHHYVSPPTEASTQKLTATWFGVTALLLSDGEHAVMIDPFFTRPTGLLNMALNREIAPDETLIRAWLDKAGIKKLDAVLVSHSHFDHAMDAGVVARLTGAMLLGSQSTANIGRGAGLPESQILIIKPGEAIHRGPFTLTFIESKHAGATGGAPTGDIAEALHPPFHYLDYRQGGTFSIFIEHPLGTVLHHGSAGFVPGALKGRHADIAFLGIALLPDLDTYLHETVDVVGAKIVVPTHWDDFTRPLDQPLLPFPVVVHLDRFFADVARLRPHLEVRTLEVNQPVILYFGHHPPPPFP
jgi:L-ascorbate metabolism protein UlaG (beta-lactamase superfamily)